MPGAVRLNRKELIELIESIEAGGGDAADLRRELDLLEPPAKPSAQVRRGGSRIEREELSTGERLNREVGDLFSDGVTSDILEKLMEIDGNYDLKELKIMCVKAGFSPSGHKKKLAAKLLANGLV